MAQKSILSFFKSPPKSTGSAGSSQNFSGESRKSTEKAKSPGKKTEEPLIKTIENGFSPKPSVMEKSSNSDDAENKEPIIRRKTARKQVRSSGKMNILPKTPISSESSSTNGFGPGTKLKPESEPASISKDSPVKKVTDEHESPAKGSTDGSDEECITRRSSKKRKKNVITDDSPVKSSQKKVCTWKDNQSDCSDVAEAEESKSETPVKKSLDEIRSSQSPKCSPHANKNAGIIENQKDILEECSDEEVTAEKPKSAKRQYKKKNQGTKSETPITRNSRSKTKGSTANSQKTVVADDSAAAPDDGDDELGSGKKTKRQSKKAKKAGKGTATSTPNIECEVKGSSKKKKAVVTDNSSDTPEEEQNSEEPMDCTDDDVLQSSKSESPSLEDTKNEAISNGTENSQKEKSGGKSPKSSVHSFFSPRSKQTDASSKESENKNSKVTKKDSTSVSYNPSLPNYHPIDDACWKKGERVPYLALAKTLHEIEQISARLKMIEILANFFRSVIVLTPEDLLYSVYLCLNRLAPEYEGIELGIGETILMKAVAQATGRTLDKIKAEVVAKGDLGSVAESSRGNQRVMFAFPKLTVISVFTKFKEISQMAGNAAMSKKTDKIQALFAACGPNEAKYIIRSLSGKLRIGLAEQSVLAALARAVVLTPPNQDYPPPVLNAASKVSPKTLKEKIEEQVFILKTTYCECPNYDLIIPVMLERGISELPKYCQLSPGVPLKPMLAQPTNGISEVLKKFDKNDFTCEFKYDGERAQIHLLESGGIKIYSRNQEDNSSKYPDVTGRLSKAFKPDVKTFILDSEAVAWDTEANQILPFQVLSTRKKKDAANSEIKVQVCILAFDLLYLNGESLVKKPLKERRSLLREFFVEVPNEFMFAHSLDGNTTEEIQEFLDESIKGKCEGLMVKSLVVDATYEIAKRSHNWLKLKKDYLEGVGDTLDLVVLGGWFGKGKRTGTYGGFLLACFDADTEEFQTICKIGTGFKDEDLDKHGKFFKEHVISSPKSYYRYDHSMEPDVWFEPVQVWEVKCADLSISPVHKAAAGIVDPEKGISLRFPRYLRTRDDKKPEDATTSTQVVQLYNNQEQVQNQKKNTVDEEDFY